MSRFDINGVATSSDADGLLKTLKHAACFGELVRDPALILLDRPAPPSWLMIYSTADGLMRAATPCRKGHG